MWRIVDRLDTHNGLADAIARQDAVSTQSILQDAMFGA